MTRFGTYVCVSAVMVASILGLREGMTSSRQVSTLGAVSIPLRTGPLVPDTRSSVQRISHALPLVRPPQAHGEPVGTSLDELVRNAETIFHGKVTDVRNSVLQIPSEHGPLKVRVRKFTFDVRDGLTDDVPRGAPYTVTTDAIADIQAGVGDEVVWYVDRRSQPDSPFSFHAPVNVVDGYFVVTREGARSLSDNRDLWADSVWTHASEKTAAAQYLLGKGYSQAESETLLSVGSLACCPHFLPLEFLKAATRSKLAAAVSMPRR